MLTATHLEQHVHHENRSTQKIMYLGPGKDCSPVIYNCGNAERTLFGRVIAFLTVNGKPPTSDLPTYILYVAGVPDSE